MSSMSLENPYLAVHMKFVALISGGKDSFFNIQHCVSRGHELIALANLYPEDSAKDEIDSYMFQTVGHQVIDMYEEALSVPLYRRKIRGGSRNQLLEYSVTKQDEIEDLFQLLIEIKAKHPGIEAVSCGAILSHYQRTRVENVCGRLELTSLAYLWQRNQLELMQEMCRSGVDARLIKVAAVGLDSRHLGKSIQQMLSQLIKLNSMYDVHICGEGGEFETLVLDASFFKKRLVISNSEVVSHLGDQVAYLAFEVKLGEKEKEGLKPLEAPSLLQESFGVIYEEVKTLKFAGEPPTLESPQTSAAPQESVISNGSKLWILNLKSDGATLQEQMVEVFCKLNANLEQHKMTFNDVQHVTLLLANMVDFSQINEIYQQNFSGFFLPPSRVCVETELAGPSKLQLSCKAVNQKQKEGLHIRSRSYWAPQNIGPYSQTIVEQHDQFKLATLSGQIPLVPSSMELYPSTSLNEKVFCSTLALQHLCSVKDLANVTNFASVCCFTSQLDFVDVAASTWASFIDSTFANRLLNLLIIVQVGNLPKGAPIEWAGVSFQEQKDMYDDSESLHNDLGDLEGLIQTVEQCNKVEINDGKVNVFTLFTNSPAVVEQMMNKSALLNLYLQLYVAAGIPGLYHHCEVIPVESLWTAQRVCYNYAATWIVEL